jgi:chromosome partitioning protein
VDLAVAESELAGRIGREKALCKKLAPIKDDFDYIFIDCPPTLGILVINALAAADSVLIPIQCEPLTLYGVKHLLQVINLIKEEVNPNLKIEGVLRTSSLTFNNRQPVCIRVFAPTTKPLLPTVFLLYIFSQLNAQDIL